MCQFKSGIILKTGCVIAEGENDSYSDLLERLNIEDSAENAMTKFVRVELIPPKNEWWTDPDSWEINVDQDITPDWFDIDREKYFNEFLKVVKDWWEIHVLVDKKIDELSSGYYRIKRCEVKKLCNDVRVVCDSSTVSEMYDSSTVSEMYGNSTVSRMYGNSTVSGMYGNSTVSGMCDSSTVSRMYDSATVSRMYGNSTVSGMYGNSTVSRMYDSATVSRMYGNSTVSGMYGNSTVSGMYGNSTVSEMYGNSIARDFSHKKIYISADNPLEIVINKEED